MLGAGRGGWSHHGKVSALRQKTLVWQQRQPRSQSYSPHVEAKHSEGDAYAGWRHFGSDEALHQVPAYCQQGALARFIALVGRPVPSWALAFCWPATIRMSAATHQSDR